MGRDMKPLIHAALRTSLMWRKYENIWNICVDSSALSYYIIIWRRTAYYMVNFVMPAVLINIISLFVFMMPSESGEKITLAISAMLNMTVFLMAVVDNLPPTDKTSIISKYRVPLKEESDPVV